MLPKPAPPIENELEADGPTPKFAEVEYGNPSSNFLAALLIACVAVSRVGRGIKDNTDVFKDGCVDIREVSRGSSDSDGRLAIKHFSVSSLCR